MESKENFRESLRTIVREWGLMHTNPCVKGVTLAQGHALIELAAGEQTIAELANKLLLDHSSASRLAARLRRNLWITFSSDSKDKRKRLLKLTKTGRAVLSSIDDESNRRVEQALSLLSTQDQNLIKNGFSLYAKAMKRSRIQAGLHLRPIKRADNKSMACIIRQVMTEMGASGAGFAIHDAEVDHMYESYRTPRSAYFVIESNGEVVGGAGIAPLAGGDGVTCELKKMYFLPEARGKGLGEKMLTLCLEKARSMKFKRCYLETTSRMIQAQALYQKLGFKPRKCALGATGHFSCDRWYEKDLT